MLFSIITVCYNSAETIRVTFDSILSQSCKDYEYIVIDGASNDGTVELIKAYEPKFEGRMQWISELDRGIYDAMNKGIQRAKGDYLNFMNSGDSYMPEALENTRQWMLGHQNYDVYYGITRLVNQKGEESHLRRFHHTLLPQGCMICHQSIFTKADLFRKNGFYRTDLKIASDYDFYLKVFTKGASFNPMDVFVVNYHEDGLSGSNQEKVEDETRQIMVEYGYLMASSEKKTRLLKKIHHVLDLVVFSSSHVIHTILKPFVKNIY